MKNVTVSLDEEIYDHSRLIAAQRRTTITGLVRDYLQGLSDQQARQEQARHEILDMIGSFGGKVGRMPSREERNARR